MTIEILLVDDHPLFRKGLRLIFEEEQDMRVVGEAGNGHEAIDLVRKLSPDVVVMDITMPDLNGIEATRQIHSESPDTKVVALSIHAGKQFVQDMLSAGAAGYFLKDSAPEELSNGIRKVLRGEVYLSSSITSVVVSEYKNLLSEDRGAKKRSADSQAAGVISAMPVNKTKLYRPPNPQEHVHRTHLIAKLDRNKNQPFTLVVAPAGYGKSTLISQWLAACDVPGAWVSLDENDNDLRTFMTYFLTAVQSIAPDAVSETRAILNARDLPPLRVLALSLINELAELEKKIILVLDDYHVIQNNAIQDLLIEIVKHPSQTLHLVLASRIDPPLPLASLRARGEMIEIRMQDLRFSLQETTEYLQKMMGKTLEDSIVTLLGKKTEGWITGLRLAVLSLRHREDLNRVLTDLPNENRYVMDYMVAEILSQQPPTMQEYLLTTSILGRFCAPLCDAVCISDTASGACKINGQEFLQLLIKANLFVVPLDDEHRWFRYHHLFQNLLQRKLKHRFKPEDIRVLHSKASTWFAENGHFEDAIQHALAGGEVERAAEIVGRARHDLMNRDQWHRLARWLKLFSHEAVQQYPHLILLRCWLDLYYWYRLDYLVKDLDRADRQLQTSALSAREAGPLKAEVAAMHSNLAYWILKPSHGVALAEQALRDSPDGHECTRTTAIFGWGPLCQMLGEAKQGERILWDHMEDGRYKHPSSQARLMLSMCIVYWPEAETQKLQQAASRLLQISPEQELLWNHSFARYFLGLIHYEQNELNEAIAHLEIIVGKPYRFTIQNVVHCSFLLSLSYQALGLPDQARQVAESTAKLTFERGNQMFIDLTEAFQANLDLRQGRIAPADKWARAFVAPASHGMQRFFNAELTAIKVLLARNTPQSLKSAAEQLDSMHKLLGRIHHRRLMIDILGMQALLADALGQESTAFEKLNEALTLAEPGGFIRPFLDLGSQMADLLKRLAKQKPDLKYAERILAAFKNEEQAVVPNASEQDTPSPLSPRPQPLIEPLTNREIEILLILSKGLSNQKIAERLFISPETVKRHLYNIYQKLDVKNRQQAIVKTKSLGIL